jgi:preprotein translocase subunit SecE
MSVTKVTSGPSTNRVVEYLQETRGEMRRVVWPTQDEAINLTVVVLFITVLMTILLGGMDLLFGKLLNFILQFGG